MITLFLYDIPNDRLRTKVADICLDYGLRRIQYSAFMGQLSSNRQEEFWLKISRLIGTAEANLQLYPLNERDLAKTRTYFNVGGAKGEAA